jgi:hypothetical protein
MKTEKKQRIFRLWIIGLGGFFLIFSMNSCAFPDQVPPGPAPTFLAFEPIISNNVFAYGESSLITTEIRNDGDIPATITGVPPEVVISIRKNGWNRGVVRTIHGGKESLTLGPHSNKRWVIPWDQKDERGTQVQAGVYYLTMNGSGINAYAEIIILKPDGALTGTLSPMQDVTSDGITTRLESVVLHNDEGRVSVLVFPSADSPASATSHGFSQITAEYRVDNGTMMNFRDAFGKSAENGAYEITWQTAPIPCNAKVLNVRATKFDPYQGDWNYSINLDTLSECTTANGTVLSRPDSGFGHDSTSQTPRSSPLPVILPCITLVFVAIIAIFERIKP